MTMRRALLLYNPVAGRNPARRQRDLDVALNLLRAGGVDSQAEAIDSPSSASGQARQAISAGYDAIIACGGDGTMHAVLQGMVGSGAALGVLPAGTGNVLAKNLGLPLEASAAAQALLDSQPRQIAVGKIESSSAEGKVARYFLLNAGVGLDALGIYRSTYAWKSRFGVWAYYLHGLRLAATHSFPLFTAEFSESSGAPRQAAVSQAAAFRVPTLGWPIGSLTPQASLERDDLQLLLFKTQRRFRYLQYSLRSALNLARATPEIELLHARELLCSATSSSSEKIYAQADGEPLGALPVRISMAAEKVTLLFPTASKPKRQ